MITRTTTKKLVYILLLFYTFISFDLRSQILDDEPNSVLFNDIDTNKVISIKYDPRIYSGFNLDWENDMWYHFEKAAETEAEKATKPDSDKNYTNGIRFVYYSDKLEIRALNRLLLLNNLKYMERYQTKNGISVYQVMYTPTKIDSLNVQYDDRPFSGATMIGYEFESVNEYDKNSSSYKYFYQGSIAFGVFGVGSYSYQTQKQIHCLINGRPNPGWVGQQMQTDFAFNLRYKGGYHILKNVPHWDLDVYGQAQIGTLALTFAQGFQFKYSLNKSDETSSFVAHEYVSHSSLPKTLRRMPPNGKDNPKKEEMPYHIEEDTICDCTVKISRDSVILSTYLVPCDSLDIIDDSLNQMKTILNPLFDSINDTIEILNISFSKYTRVKNKRKLFRISRRSAIKDAKAKKRDSIRYYKSKRIKKERKDLRLIVKKARKEIKEQKCSVFAFSDSIQNKKYDSYSKREFVDYLYRSKYGGNKKNKVIVVNNYKEYNGKIYKSGKEKQFEDQYTCYTVNNKPYGCRKRYNKTNFHVYFDNYTNIIGYNSFLSGGLLNNIKGKEEIYSIPNSDINRFVYTARLGVDLNIYFVTLGYYVGFRSKEIELPKATSQLFGRFRVKINFR